MELKLNKKNFIICGATSGFGNAITLQLIEEGANVLAVARGEEKLKELYVTGQVYAIDGGTIKSTL